MPAADQAKALRALADSFDELAKLETAHDKAVEAYRKDPSDKNKTTYRKTSEALREARAAARGNDKPRAVVPGDVSLTPGTVGS